MLVGEADAAYGREVTGPTGGIEESGIHYVILVFSGIVRE
jgi:hypothetical protein